MRECAILYREARCAWSGRQTTRSHAFTLIELLVVIAIIIILAAILFPVFARAKVAAWKTTDLVHIRQLSIAQTMYTEDFDEHFLTFPLAGVSSNPVYNNGEKGPFWSDRQMPYVKSAAIFKSPSNNDKVYIQTGYFAPGATTPGEPGHYKVTYAVNPLISHAFANPDNPGAAATTNIEDPSTIVALGPSQTAWQFSSCVEDPPGSGRTKLMYMFSASDSWWGFELFGGKNDKGGFDGGANFAYVDLHAKFQRTVNQGTAPGDHFYYRGRDLFRGYFRGAVIRDNIATDGTCPGDRATLNY